MYIRVCDSDEWVSSRPPSTIRLSRRIRSVATETQWSGPMKSRISSCLVIRLSLTRVVDRVLQSFTRYSETITQPWKCPIRARHESSDLRGQYCVPTYHYCAHVSLSCQGETQVIRSQGTVPRIIIVPMSHCPIRARHKSSDLRGHSHLPAYHYCAHVSLCPRTDVPTDRLFSIRLGYDYDLLVLG